MLMSVPLFYNLVARGIHFHVTRLVARHQLAAFGLESSLQECAFGLMRGRALEDNAERGFGYVVAPRYTG